MPLTIKNKPVTMAAARHPTTPKTPWQEHPYRFSDAARQTSLNSTCINLQFDLLEKAKQKHEKATQGA